MRVYEWFYWQQGETWNRFCHMALRKYTGGGLHGQKCVQVSSCGSSMCVSCAIMSVSMLLVSWCALIQITQRDTVQFLHTPLHFVTCISKHCQLTPNSPPPGSKKWWCAPSPELQYLWEYSTVGEIVFTCVWEFICPWFLTLRTYDVGLVLEESSYTVEVYPDVALVTYWTLQ